MGPSDQLTTCSSTSTGSTLEGFESDTKLAFISLSKDISKTDSSDLHLLAEQCGKNEKFQFLTSFYAKLAKIKEAGNYENITFFTIKEQEICEKYHFIEYIIGQTY